MSSKEHLNKLVRESLKRRRAKLKLAGRCVDCGLPKTPNDKGSLCETCKEMRRMRENTRRARKKAM